MYSRGLSLCLRLRLLPRRLPIVPRANLLIPPRLPPLQMLPLLLLLLLVPSALAHADHEAFPRRSC